jgi:5-formyltetrahydrofolate cyclo-ligase
METAEKQRIRETVWSRLERSGVSAFPGARGRIPNFKGARDAARRLAETLEWRRAATIKCNPDAPQRPVRLLALQQGKVVYMAVPRLRTLRCFLRLDPRLIRDIASASTIAGAGRFGRPVDPRGLPHIDMVVAGSVAVNRMGTRLGKGGGYSDLEYAIGRMVGVVDATTVVATTVHPLQIVEGPLPSTAHDVPLDLIVTPDEEIRPRRSQQKPRGILPAHLPTDYRDHIPILRELGC